MRVEKSIQKINVLHLVEHMEVGGAERVIADIVQTLDRNLVHSTICLYRNMGVFAEELQNAGYPIVFLRKDFLSRFLPRILQPPILILEALIFIIRLIMLIRKNNIQIVHSHLVSANLWGRIARLVGRDFAIITTEHSMSGWQKTIKSRIFNKLLAPFSDRVVAVSNSVAKVIARNSRLAPGKLIVIPNGIRLSAFKQSRQIDSKKNISGTIPRIGIIACLMPIKRHDLLLRALKICVKRIPSMSCLVIGNGPERFKLELMVKILNLERCVFFLGERYDVSELLQYIDVVVSTSDHEGLPMNLLEAMAAGLPIVATNVGGTGEIVKDGETGILVEAGNIQAIADGICKIIENTELAKRMGLMCKRNINEFYSLEKIIKQWERLYQDILVESGRKLNF